MFWVGIGEVEGDLEQGLATNVRERLTSGANQPRWEAKCRASCNPALRPALVSWFEVGQFFECVRTGRWTGRCAARGSQSAARIRREMLRGVGSSRCPLRLGFWGEEQSRRMRHSKSITLGPGGNAIGETVSQGRARRGLGEGSHLLKVVGMAR